MPKISEFYTELGFKVNDEGLKELNSRMQTLTENLKAIQSNLKQANKDRKAESNSAQSGLREELKLIRDKHLQLGRQFVNAKRLLLIDKKDHEQALKNAKIRGDEAKKTMWLSDKIAEKKKRDLEQGEKENKQLKERGSIFKALVFGYAAFKGLGLGFNTISEVAERSTDYRNMENLYDFSKEFSQQVFYGAKAKGGINPQGVFSGLAAIRKNIEQAKIFGKPGDLTLYNFLADETGLNPLDWTPEELYEEIGTRLPNLKKMLGSNTAVSLALESAGATPDLIRFMQEYKGGLPISGQDVNQIETSIRMADDISEIKSAIVQTKDTIVTEMAPSISIIAKDLKSVLDSGFMKQLGKEFNYMLESMWTGLTFGKGSTDPEIKKRYKEGVSTILFPIGIMESFGKNLSDDVYRLLHERQINNSVVNNTTYNNTTNNNDYTQNGFVGMSYVNPLIGNIFSTEFNNTAAKGGM